MSGGIFSETSTQTSSTLPCTAAQQRKQHPLQVSRAQRQRAKLFGASREIEGHPEHPPWRVQPFATRPACVVLTVVCWWFRIRGSRVVFSGCIHGRRQRGGRVGVSGGDEVARGSWRQLKNSGTDFACNFVPADPIPDRQQSRRAIGGGRVCSLLPQLSAKWVGPVIG